MVGNSCQKVKELCPAGRKTSGPLFLGELTVGEISKYSKSLSEQGVKSEDRVLLSAINHVS